MPGNDDLPPVAGARLELLRGLGFGELTHDSRVPFLSHLVGDPPAPRRVGTFPDLCDAGLFHSVYGTEFFPTAALVSRSEVRLVIGARAERLAWLWCTIRRDTIDATAGTAVDRHSGGLVALAPGELSGIATLWAADTVEQLGRMARRERGFAQGLPAVLHLASAPARRAAADVLSPSLRR